MEIYSWKERISKHDMIIEGPLTHPFESIHIGNGDIGASVNVFPHEIKITVGKSDIWDSRFDCDPESFVLSHDDLIKLVKEKDRDLYNEWEVGKEKADYKVDWLASNNAHTSGPALRRACRIRLYHPGLSKTKVETRVRLIDGVVETEFFFSQGKLVVRAFVERVNSRIWLQAESVGETPWFALVVEKEPDDSDITMPLPVMEKERERLTTIKQTIPAGHDLDEFNWVVAALFPVGKEGIDARGVEHHAWRLRQYCALKPGHKTELCVAIATDMDGTGDTRNRALALATEADNKSFDEIFIAHQDDWEKYWSTSNIALSDNDLESVWYRNQFGFGCALRRDMLYLGSGGNLPLHDFAPWHGDIHMNHNFQKWYCTALPTNHPEWIDVYADFIEDKLPMFEYQAELIFQLEGAYCDLSYLPVMLKEHCNFDNFIGRALAMTGWAGLPLWHHWEFMRDEEWLRKRAYPYIKKAAQFYYNYLEKYSDETNEIFPSIRLEEPGWCKDFIRNRNVLTDLCMFKKAFTYAIDAATVLDVDEDWREKWDAARARVPEIGHGFDEDGHGWLALDRDWHDVEPKRRAEESRHSRWGGGGWIVYPGEHVWGDGDDSLTLVLRDMMRKTDLLNPFVSQITGELVYPGVPVIHPISSLVPTIRLGVIENYERLREVLLAHRLSYGQAVSYMMSDGEIPKEVNSNAGYLWYDWRSVENKYAGILATTEMLIQSQGGVMRLFPFMPDSTDAAFNKFRAQGGFVVSAERKGNALSALIESEAGESVRLKSSVKPVSITCITCDDASDVSYMFEDGLIKFDTKAGCIYKLEI